MKLKKVKANWKGVSIAKETQSEPWIPEVGEPHLGGSGPGQGKLHRRCDREMVLGDGWDLELNQCKNSGQ